MTEKIIKLRINDKNRLLYHLQIYKKLGWDCDFKSVSYDSFKKKYSSSIKLDLSNYNTTNKIEKYKKRKFLEIGNIIDGKKEGLWYEFQLIDDIKILTKISPYKNNYIHGQVISFYRNGTLHSIEYIRKRVFEEIKKILVLHFM